MRRMSWYKAMLVSAGRLLNTKVIHQMNATINYLEVGRWLKDEAYDVERQISGRPEIFELMAQRIAHQRVLYLEFGVFQGRSIAYWSKTLTHPEAHIHGFDSFEGLPEDWNYHFPKDYFALGGKVPQFDDPRVQLFKGWFHETLPDYRLPEHDVLFVNLDADLYVSTKVVLDHLQDHLPIGTYLYFDEFCDRLQEKRAFEEYLHQTQHRYRILAADPTLANVLFQRVA